MNILINIVLGLIAIGAFVCVGIPLMIAGLMFVIAVVGAIITLIASIFEAIVRRFRR